MQERVTSKPVETECPTVRSWKERGAQVNSLFAPSTTQATLFTIITGNMSDSIALTSLHRLDCNTNKMMTTPERRAGGNSAHHSQQHQYSGPTPSHRSRRRRRNQITGAAATTCLVSTSAAAVLLSKLPSAVASTGGFLADPQSRNYIAYKTTPIVPSASQPESLLAEEEPTPHKIKSGQRCGVTGGGKRNYNRPMSRAESLLPLNIQEVYVSGSDIEVTVNLFGVEDGGHFEFHICALEYPQEPTEECFQQYPLTFVKDHYYAAVKDETYPERAYIPYERAFNKNVNPLTRVEIEGTTGLGSMMEFKYTFKLPESTDLRTDLEVIDSSSVSVQVPLVDIDSVVDDVNVEIVPAMTQMNGQVFDDINEKYASFEGKTYTSGSTGSSAVLISAMVTDGKGTTTVVSVNDVPTIHVNGPVVEATAICTFGDKSIYGLGVMNIPEEINRICGVIEESPLEAASAPAGDSDTDSNGDFSGDNASSIPIPPFPRTKYALLRWHYQTARNCFPSGYDSYAWPEEWGSWKPQRDGECDDYDESEDEYWNCAEVLILDPAESVSKPTANKDIFIIDANEEAQLDVLANDANPNEDEPLHVGYVTSPMHGTFEISEDGSAVIYFPDEDYVGLDSFEYDSCDKSNSCDTAAVDIQVSPTTDFVFANSDEATTTGTEPVFVDVLANDIVRIDNWPLFVLGTPRDGRHGKCTVTPDFWILYKANPGYEGRDRCSYKACITTDICDTGVVYINVKSVQEDAAADPSTSTSGYNIVAVDDSAVTQVNQPIQINVLVNDEANGNVKPKIKSSDGSSNGDCEVLDNEILYTPASGFIGWDQCSYTACLGNDICDEALIKIKITGTGDDALPEVDVNSTQDSAADPTAPTINSDPVARPDNASVVEGSSVRIDVLQNDEDPDEDSLEVSSVTSPLHGSVKIVNNLLRYTSITGFTGTDSFKYTACDKANRCDSAGVIVTITAEVLAVDDSVTTYSAPILIDVTANDRSSSGSLVVTNTKDGKHGSCSITASNKVKYIPNDGYLGWDRCSYIVCAGSACDQGRVEIEVLSLVDLADLEKVYAKDDHIVAFLGESITVDVVSNDFVKGMGPLTITYTGGSKNGSCAITNDNKILYKPKNGFRGSDACGYTICHASNMCDDGILRIDVIQRKVLRSYLTSPADNTSTDEIVFITASADATITTEFPAGNFGDVTTLFVSGASSRAGLRDTMMKFDTSSIGEFDCRNGIEGATVSIYSLAYASDGGTLITTSDKFWTEMSVTWNDAPVGDGIVINDMGSVEVNTWYDLDVSSAVTLGDPLSIRIISHAGGESIALYASRDHPNDTWHPVLKIRCSG